MLKSKVCWIGLLAAALMVLPVPAQAGGVIVTWGETLPDSFEDPDASSEAMEPTPEAATQQVVHAEAGDPVRALLAQIVWASLAYDEGVEVDPTTPSIYEAVTAHEESDDDDNSMTMSQAVSTNAAESLGEAQGGCAQTSPGGLLGLLPWAGLLLSRRRRRR